MIRYDENAGDWQGLDSQDQAPRYLEIASILKNFGADLDVLDVGCGEALL